MDVVDRVSATDRAVAAYRRFVSADGIDIVPDMISDLLHWHRIMIDTHVSADALRGMLDSALDQYTSELARFGLGDDPLTGNRRESNPFRVDEAPLTMPARSEYPSYSAEDSVYVPMPEPAPSVYPDERDHPAYEAGLCNCEECLRERAIDAGLTEYDGEWITGEEAEERDRIRTAVLREQRRLLTATWRELEERDQPF
jgi:hypothetical protein